jgi:hypothetical protein
MDDRAFTFATKASVEIRNRRVGYVELLDFYRAMDPAPFAIVTKMVCTEPCCAIESVGSATIR